MLRWTAEYASQIWMMRGVFIVAMRLNPSVQTPEQVRSTDGHPSLNNIADRPRTQRDFYVLRIPAETESRRVSVFRLEMQDLQDPGCLQEGPPPVHAPRPESGEGVRRLHHPKLSQ